MIHGESLLVSEVADIFGMTHLNCDDVYAMLKASKDLVLWRKRTCRAPERKKPKSTHQTFTMTAGKQPNTSIINTKTVSSDIFSEIPWYAPGSKDVFLRQINSCNDLNP